MKKVALFLLLLVLVFSARPQAATLDLMQNGNFNLATPTPPAVGIPKWVSSTSTGENYYAPTINNGVGNPAGSGAPCAIVGGTTSYQGTSSLLQYVYVPPDALGNTLMMYYQWVADQCLQTFDWAEGRVQGIPFFHEEPTIFPQVDPTPGWRQITPYVELRNYRNTTITVEIVTHCDAAALQTNYLEVDDVALWCTTATKTSTPTPSFTPTITPTSTISPTNTVTPTITPTYTITPTITQTSTNTPWVVKNGDVTVYPNPASGKQVNFLYSPATASSVKIDVYNLAGLKVAHLEDANKAGAANQVTTWNIGSVAPGVYLYQLTLEDANGIATTAKMKKLVITK